jgi:methylthioribose-1-phosphate isomerase
MKIGNHEYRTIWPDPEQPAAVCIIDQRQLPHRFVIERLTDVETTRIAIKDMHVRGAGLIGATAGFGMYLAAVHASEERFDQEMTEAAARLCNSRPTARNLSWAVDRVLGAIGQKQTPEEKREAAFRTACAIADEDAEFCRRIGRHGLSLIAEISLSLIHI